MKNTLPSRNKARRSKGQKTIVDRFSMYKIKNKSAENTSRPKFKVGNEILPENVFRRTSLERVKSSATRCNMKLYLLMNNHSERWFLSNKFSLCHKHHHEFSLETEKFESTELNDDESSWMNQMYAMGLSNGTIAGILTGFLNSKGKKGSFSPQDIRNMTTQYSKELDLLSGVSQDMTQDERTIDQLNK